MGIRVGDCVSEVEREAEAVNIVLHGERCNKVLLVEDLGLGLVKKIEKMNNLLLSAHCTVYNVTYSHNMVYSSVYDYLITTDNIGNKGSLLPFFLVFIQYSLNGNSM